MSEEQKLKKRKRKVKKKKEKLPRKIIATGNKDKDSFKDDWYEGRDPLDFPRPYRCVLSGPPSSGKSCIIKNIMARGDFDEVYLCHTDSTTNEYDDVDIVWQDTKLPEIEMVRGARDVNKLLIIEDMDLTRMSKEERHTLDRICGNVSSHSNLSIFYTSQDPISVPLCVRRTANIFILWPQPDLIALHAMARRTGKDQEMYQKFFSKCTGPHDAVWLDLTKQTPYPIRLNGYTMLDKEGNIKQS